MHDMSVDNSSWTIERDYPHPPERVFAAWADPSCTSWAVAADDVDRCQLTEQVVPGGQIRETATELVAGAVGAEYDDRRTSRIQWRKVTSWTCSSSPASQ